MSITNPADFYYESHRLPPLTTLAGVHVWPNGKPPAAPPGGPSDNRPVQARVLEFLNDLSHPEQYGHAVTREVRQRARELATAMKEEANNANPR